MKEWAKKLRQFLLKQSAWLLVGGFIVFNLNMPITWFENQLKQITHEHLQLNAVQGNLWNGQAQLVLSDGENSKAIKAIPGWLKWRFIWNGFELTHPLLNAPLQITYNDGQINCTGHSINIPAVWLKTLGSPWNTIDPGGTFKLYWLPAKINQQFSWSIQWLDAQSALSTVKPLGNYELQGKLKNLKQFNMQLKTLNGDLQLQGQGGWSFETGWHFDGKAQTNPIRLKELSLLLKQISPQDNNQFRLKIQ